MAVENFPKLAMTASGRSVTSRRSFIIYTKLQREIVLGMLAPRSTLLELELAGRFEASQGTVREALLLLQEEGLVHRLPHRGTTIADCRAEDAEELIRLRHDIECRGVRRAIKRHGADLAGGMRAHVEAMQQAAGAGDEYLLSAHDRAFHTELFERADLPPVPPVLARALVHAHRYKICIRIKIAIFLKRRTGISALLKRWNLQMQIRPPKHCPIILQQSWISVRVFWKADDVGFAPIR